MIKSNYIRILLFFGFWFVIMYSYAQEVLTFDRFMEIVRTHHPVARIGDLRVESGEAELIKAKGGFDPKIQVDHYQKSFGQSDYFNNWYGKISMPTPLGIGFQGGIERNVGSYLNPENFTGNSNLYFAGVMVPLGNGLLIDERRSNLWMAEKLRDIGLEERRILLNDLYFDATIAYLNWFRSFHQMNQVERILNLAEVRQQGVRNSVLLGDRAPIDSVETSVQVQNRLIQYQKLKANWIKSQQNLSLFLWSEDHMPMALNPVLIPEDMESNLIPADFFTIDNWISIDHPVMARYQLEVDRLLIEKRLMTEQLKPEVNILYNFLTDSPTEAGTLSINDYKLGLAVSMPIFLRKERGALQKTKLKIEENELKLTQKSRELENKVIALTAMLEVMEQQLEAQRRANEQYKTLFEAEQRLFQVGESSIFMINSRENSYTQSSLKLIETMEKYFINQLEIKYWQGNLGNNQ